MPHSIWVIRVLWVKFISHCGEKHVPHTCDVALGEKGDKLGGKCCQCCQLWAHSSAPLCPRQGKSQGTGIILENIRTEIFIVTGQVHQLLHKCKVHLLEPSWPFVGSGWNHNWKGQHCLDSYTVVFYDLSLFKMKYGERNHQTFLWGQYTCCYVSPLLVDDKGIECQ